MIEYPDITAIQRHWVWFLILGIVSIVLGALAIVRSAVATVVSVLFFGWLLFIGGVVQIILAFTVRDYAHRLFHILGGVLQVVVGLLLVSYPLAGALALTLVLAAFFVTIGIFRIFGSTAFASPNWGWTLASGIVSVILGVLVISQWPYTGLWFLGLLIGIEMIVYGWSWVMLSIFVGPSVRHLGHEEPHAAMG
jgi:uncharacterized membrane protein HdeD (DUF308 family)